MYGIFNIRRDYTIFKQLGCKFCCEVGVQRGKNSKQLYRDIQPTELHLIDPWKHLSKKEYPGDGANKPQKKMDEFFQETKKRLKEGIDRKVIRIYRDKSENVLPTFSENSFDFFYLDGNHSEKYVLKDLEMAYRVVRKDERMNPKGYICGHDFFSKRHSGVTKAVKKFLYKQPHLSLIYSAWDNFIISSQEYNEKLYTLIEKQIRGCMYADWNFLKNWR